MFLTAGPGVSVGGREHEKGGVMYGGMELERGDVLEGFLTTASWVGDLPNPALDRALAEQAVAYLRGRGLDDQAVVQCLREEFEIDLATAEAMAYPWAMGPGGDLQLGS